MAGGGARNPSVRARASASDDSYTKKKRPPKTTRKWHTNTNSQKDSAQLQTEAIKNDSFHAGSFNELSEHCELSLPVHFVPFQGKVSLPWQTHWTET